MGLLIGQLAEEAGVSVETVRYYERQGLLERPKRTNSKFRRYDSDSVAKLRFIRRAKELGFSLKDILTLLSLRIDPSSTRADVKAKTIAKIAEIEGRIRDLSKMKETLESLVHACSGHGKVEGCPIITAMDHEKPKRDS